MACIGFVAFDQYKQLLADAEGKVTGPRAALAGFAAGVTESLLAVTPTESIKTQLYAHTSPPPLSSLPKICPNTSNHSLLVSLPLHSIDDRKRPVPRMRGFLHAVPIIYRERGVAGFFAGFVPTTARQAANSAVRFGSYNFLKQAAQSYTAPGEKLSTPATFGIGATAGLITVLVTQPLDTIKTRMQSLDARKEYGNTARCAARIFREEGVLTFWSGVAPRLVRLVMSGAIVFTMYEKCMEGFDRMDPERKYI